MSSIAALRAAALSVQVPFDLLRAICTVESNLDHTVINRNDGNSDSHGLCQVKYETATLMGYKGSIQGLYNPYSNALYAAKYLRYQLLRYKGDRIKAVSAYNRGTAGNNYLYVGRVFKQLIKETKNVGSGRTYKEYPDCPGEFSH